MIPYILGYILGRLLGLLIVSLLPSLLVFYLSKRSHSAASITFLIVVALGALGQYPVESPGTVGQPLMMKRCSIVSHPES